MSRRETPKPKFRATCEWCGQRSPRPTTAWTTDKWMRQHETDCPAVEPARPTGDPQ